MVQGLDLIDRDEVVRRLRGHVCDGYEVSTSCMFDWLVMGSKRLPDPNSGYEPWASSDVLDRLADLIEGAPTLDQTDMVPNPCAHELAERLRRCAEMWGGDHGSFIEALDFVNEELEVGEDNRWNGGVSKLFRIIADRVDEAGHAKPDTGRFVELPLDADGVPWHIGDVMECGDTVAVMFLEEKGWSMLDIAGPIDPSRQRHYKPRTLDDIIAECDYESIIDGECEYVEKRIREAYEMGKRNGANDD